MKCVSAIGKRLLIVSVAIVLGLEFTGCAAFILGSAAGSLGYAGYEYAQADSHTQAKPTPKPTLSMDDIE